MEFFINFPFFSIVMSLVCAAVSSVLKHTAARILCFCSNIAAIALSACTLVLTVTTGSAYSYRMGHFDAPWGNMIRFGPLESFLAVFFCMILLLSVRGGLKHLYDDNDEYKLNYYFALINLLQAAILALLYTDDVFTAYVFIEICTLASTGILMIRQVGRTTVAAVRYLIFNLLGSGLFLIGIIILYDITGHLLIPNIAESVTNLVANGEYPVPLLISASLITLGLAVKSGLFPFCYWMPDTYGYATTASSSIISGIVSKIYIFTSIKMLYRVMGASYATQSHITDVLFVFGLAGMIIGSLHAIREKNINRMVAFSSAAQIGYIYAAIGLGSEAGLAAAVFHMMTHALTKPLLFTAADGLIDAVGNRKDFASLRGSAHLNRLAGIGFTVGSLSMVGLPAFSGFVSKLLIAEASTNVAGKMLATLIVLSVSTILNAVYFLHTVITIYTPRTPDLPVYGVMKNRKGLFAVYACFIAAILLLGLHPQPVLNILSSGITLFVK